LNALNALPPDLAERFETWFIGRVTDQERAYLNEPRRSQVKQFGFMSQDRALKLIEETDYLLVTMTDPVTVPGKVYEYLATGKPIVAFSPPGGDLSRLLTETDGGWCVDPNDHESACQVLQLAAMQVHDCAEPLVVSNHEAIRKFDRESLTGEYARLVRELS